MTNPFEAFNISDDEDAFQPTTVQQQKVKRTHQEKKQYKLQQEVTKTSAPVVTEELPERVRQNAKNVRNTRAPPTPQTKKLGEGHYLDRRSGTGRVDRPRKEGGGKGNIGNTKDQLNQDKYIKQNAEQSQPVSEIPATTQPEQPAEVKPVEPEKLTLEEYYKAKGVEINNVYEKKAVAKKVQLNAEWIKKEKLTVLQSKEDKKNNQRNAQNVVKFTSTRVGLDENLQSLGFGQKPTTKKPEEKRDNRPQNKGKGKKEIVHDEDFPSL